MVTEDILQMIKHLMNLENNKQVLYYYCDEKGNVDKSFNPNHAIRNIAGISNKARKCFWYDAAP